MHRQYLQLAQREDDSPTIMMPGDSIGYPPEAKEKEEEEPQ
jgi:hypothetical protein